MQLKIGAFLAISSFIAGCNGDTLNNRSAESVKANDMQDTSADASLTQQRFQTPPKAATASQ